MSADDDLEKMVSVDPDVCHGKPCFTGTRILVSDILSLLEAGVPVAEITGDDYFPQLMPGHVKAALHFAATELERPRFVAFSR